MLFRSFNITSNPELFFESASHKQALAVLLYGIRRKKGIILITGEVGTGKTTLCKILLNRIPVEVKTSLILNPYFSPIQLLQAIIEDFGLSPAKRNRLAIMQELNSFLLRINQTGATAVVIIDEAQDLTVSQLEQIRLLSNLETFQHKLLQIVLVGQPELTEKLGKYNLRQIRQRIFVKHNLLPLNISEVSEYITFRLRKSGAMNDITILPESLKIIYNFSGGVPRLINMLCDRALLCGFARETNIFGAELFKTCIEELQ